MRFKKVPFLGSPIVDISLKIFCKILIFLQDSLELDEISPGFFFRKNLDAFFEEKKVDKIAFFEFSVKIFNIFFDDFPEILRFRGKFGACSSLP